MFITLQIISSTLFKKIPPIFYYANFQTYKKFWKTYTINTHIPAIQNVSFAFCYFCYVFYDIICSSTHASSYQSVLYFDHFEVNLKYQHTVCCLSKHFRMHTISQRYVCLQFTFFLLRETLGEKTHIVSEPLDGFNYVHTCASENTTKIRDIIISCKEPIAAPSWSVLTPTFLSPQRQPLF